ncbi:putative phospholipid-transporting ATPase IA [Symbiodinium microadriaticum]|uniref:Putative phospholipid-transporting ATPase IA n=1 Tax=Symbiodinium microadriaticum TaxID=2951 RepID=A0A1Q9D8T5_SYMMI|nr:putative phospholipid-transporting ATPase IA [Symbiodinium microadriaticum]
MRRPQPRAPHAAVEDIDDYRVVKLFHEDKKRNNAVKSNKYTWYDFVPKNLFEQFSQLGNIYFMLVAVGQLFPSISNTKGRPATLLPLSGVVLMQAIKDLFEDWQRIASDQKENSNPATAVDANMAEPLGEVQKIVGTVFEEVVRVLLDAGADKNVTNNDGNTALIVASLAGHAGAVKVLLQVGVDVDLADNDGTTALMAASAAPGGHDAVVRLLLDAGADKDVADMTRSSIEWGQIRPGMVLKLRNEGYGDDPSQEAGNGAWSLNLKKKTAALTPAELESAAQNVRFVGSLELTNGEVVAMIFAIQMSICLFISLSSFLWQSLHGHKVWYLEGLPQYLNPLRQVGIWFLMLNSMVPISLMITVTVVKFAQGKIMSQDEGCGSNGKNAEVHTSQVIDSLGQVFSDKTGTLTQNVMEYRACSADSVAGEAPYNASSPDELALAPGTCHGGLSGNPKKELQWRL